ncbi:MAG: bifunctional precorrin-2 dehydrogenase/sirohydrochlorin ferrochelatase [Chloroflexi bacterium]|nr:bifunctional precorrin-2 dehydrogenase/sirohydrochlorin ferrochelatase [Chloroflexota bacterium]
MQKYYPVLLNLKTKKCLVVGGGPVAARKAEDLLDCGASVKVISKQIGNDIKNMGSRKGLTLIERPFTEPDLDGAFLVIAATGDGGLNSNIAGLCSKLGILINVVDDEDLCGFIVPSTLRRGDLAISVSTSGRFAGLSRKIKNELEPLFPPCCIDILEALFRLREKVKINIHSEKERKEFWDKFFNEVNLLDAFKHDQKFIISKISELSGGLEERCPGTE